MKKLIDRIFFKCISETITSVLYVILTELENNSPKEIYMPWQRPSARL